jgi:DNA-binding Lrp family transcriptional regulator
LFLGNGKVGKSLKVDNLDKRLLNLVQSAFPLVETPYAELGGRLDISGAEVIHRIAGLKTERLIRLIAPVVDGRRLGFQSTLVAATVPPEKLAGAEAVITAHPGVSHGYERDHALNVWFTLSSPPGADIETEIVKLAAPLGARAIFSLPVLRLFKIGVHFDMGETGPETGAKADVSGSLSGMVALSLEDKLVINALQVDLPLTARPFDLLAEQVGLPVTTFLAQARALLERGVIRRYGAAIDHLAAGYRANAMTGWVVSPENLDFAGKTMAALKQVSHCYERRTNPIWRYNLFTMIHSRTKDECQALVSEMSGQTGLNEFVMLYSTREFKKIRVRYLV